MEVNIRRLPNTINPDNMIKFLVRKKYGEKCPFCGETRKRWDCLKDKDLNAGVDCGGIYIHWYGYPDDIDAERSSRSLSKDLKDLITFRHLKEKHHHWRIDDCTCHTCGAEWETPPYPTDVLSQDELNKIYGDLKLLIEEN